MKTYDIHETAGLVPMAVASEQQALTNDIRDNGQREDATLYRGKIVDGRCRYKACSILGLELKVKELPNNMSITEVEAFVKSVNTRRNLTRSQKVIAAYRSMLKSKLSMAKVAARWAITSSEVSHGKFISVNRPDYAERLFQGEPIQVGYDKIKDKPIYSASISRVKKYIESEMETVVPPPGHQETELDEVSMLRNMIRLLEQENDEYRASNTELLIEIEEIKATKETT